MPSSNVSNGYVFSRRDPGLFIEIYFPNRVPYKADIAKALEEGVDEKKVKTYLEVNLAELRDELAEYKHIFDPDQYTWDKKARSNPITEDQAKKRIDMYKSPFCGWSSYNVEGAFLNTKKKGNPIDDELVHIVRIIFRFESKYMKSAKKKGCQHILKEIASWILDNYYHRMVVFPWSRVERDRFITQLGSFSEKELEYIRLNYIDIARETVQWFDDSALLIFGFLVRRFWNCVKEAGRKEDEIWVTSWFNVGINTMRPGEKTKIVIL